MSCFDLRLLEYEISDECAVTSRGSGTSRQQCKCFPIEAIGCLFRFGEIAAEDVMEGGVLFIIARHIFFC